MKVEEAVVICLALQVSLAVVPAGASPSLSSRAVAVATCGGGEGGEGGGGGCECTEEVDQHDDLQFRVVCVGNKTKSVLLDESLFASKEVNSVTKKIYVRIHNFASAEIKSSFLSLWLSYPYCSLDIWNSGRVNFPKQTPEVPQTDFTSSNFIGIGVGGSSIDRFPENLFKNKESAGLKLQKDTNIDYLNIADLSPKKLKYLTMERATIKGFGGNQPLTLEESHQKQKVDIKNCKIGYLYEGALAFNDYRNKYYMRAGIIIKNSTIGILEDSSIKLGTGIDFQIVGSDLGKIEGSAIQVSSGSRGLFSITNSTLSLEEDSLTMLECGPLVKIHNNYIHPKLSSDCILNANEKIETNLSLSCNNISNYIHPSCKNNIFVHNLKTDNEPKTSTPVNTFLASTAYYLIAIVIIIVLILVCTVIAGCIALRKNRRSTKESYIVKYRPESTLYDEPCLETFPPRLPPPSSCSYDQNFAKGKAEENEYEQLPTRKVASDADGYLDMKPLAY